MKTRLVLDLDGGIRYSHSLMPDGQTVVIDLPQVAWDALANWTAKSAPLLESYSTEALPGGGTRLTLRTSELVRIGYHGLIRPHEGKGHRFVMDLYPR